MGFSLLTSLQLPSFVDGTVHKLDSTKVGSDPHLIKHLFCVLNLMLPAYIRFNLPTRHLACKKNPFPHLVKV